MATRREFLDALAVSAATLAVGTTARSYSRILGSNDRLNFAVIGLNGRGYAHLSSLKANKSMKKKFLNYLKCLAVYWLKCLAKLERKQAGLTAAAAACRRH